MNTLERLQTLLRDQPAKPPIERWEPPLSGDMDMEIRSDGEWYHEGGRIVRRELVRLFASILRREGDGAYYLVTPVEKWRIRVEDAPLVAVDFECAGEGERRELAFRLNTGEWVPLDASHRLDVTEAEDGEPRPYLSLERGLHALVARAAYYRLVDLAIAAGPVPGEGAEGQHTLYLHSHGETFALGRIHH